MTETGAGPQVATPVGDAPVIPLFLLGTGMYLAWFGVHYWRGDVKWPTDPVKAALGGRPLPAAARSGISPHAQLTADVAALQPDAGTSGTGTGGSGSSSGSSGQNLGSVGAGAATNQQLARMLATAMGHADWTTGQQWADWVWLWNQESGWSAIAYNAGASCDGVHHAYGIAQACGHAGPQDASAHDAYGGYGLSHAQARAANNGEARWQIVWGIGYIHAEYGSPSAVRARYHSGY